VVKYRASSRLCLIITALGLPAGALAQARNALRQRARSNILLIIADDLGNDKVGVYNEGDKLTRPKTPNIDSLAVDGVRFLNAYSNPVCSPTRATMLTGRYAFRTGIGTVTNHCRFGLGLALEEISIPEMLDLAGSGYDHSHVGKWHLNTAANGGVHGPLLQGFNWAAGSPSNLVRPCNICDDCGYYWWKKQTNGEVEWTTEYATTDTTNDAIARANEMAEPWFMSLAYNAPHMPFHVPPSHLHNQPDPEGDDVRMYAAMVEALDTELGRLLASIEPRILDNTTIIFLGDNGTPAAATVPPYDPERAKKTVYEGGINVPFIVAGSAVPHSSRGRTSRALVNTTDVYATVAEIAGVDLEGVFPHEFALDSVSLLPLMAEPVRVNGPRRFAYAERFKPNGPGPYVWNDRAIRDQRWKLVRSFRPNRVPVTIDEFYDLDNAAPGLDGDDLCPCPENLGPDERVGYERLVRELEALSGP
jgi:arylsulfatase A-like enzyme